MDTTTDQAGSAQLVGTFTSLAHADIRPSPFNHRKKFTGIEEIGDSIVAKGMIQPLTVRPSPPPAKKGPRLDPTPYELVCGERRWRGAGLRGITHVPVIIRELSDVEVLEIQLIENVQRADVHPLEEALGFHDLMERHGYTVERIVAKTGKARSWVYTRLKLVDLVEEVRDAFLADQITTQVALALARLPMREHQAEALRGVLGLAGREYDEAGIDPPTLGAAGGDFHGERPTQPLTTKQALAFLERRYMLDLGLAKFPLDDATLVPDVGDCGACTHRTGNQPDLFGDVSSADTCTQPPCFEKKTAAWWKRQADSAAARGVKVLPTSATEEVFDEYARGDKVRHGSKYVEASATLDYNDGWKDGKAPSFAKLLGKEGLAAVPRVLVQAPSGAAVEMIDRAAAIKAAKDAGKLKKAPAPKSDSNGAEATARRALERRKMVVERAVPRIARAAGDAFKADSIREGIGWWRWVATGLVEKLGSDDLAAVARSLKLEPRKGKGSSNYDGPKKAILEEIDSAAATPQGIRYVIAVCLTADGGAAGWQSSPTFGTAFKATAVRWKVDLAKVAAEVDAEAKAAAAKAKPAKKGGKS